MSSLTALGVYGLIALLAACLFVAVFRKDRGEEFARDSDAEELRRQMKGAGVHSHSAIAKEARHHV
jgi:hypothetical protein